MAILFRALLLCLPLSAGEFYLISTSPFYKLGLFATANLVLGQLHLYEQGQCAGLTVDFDRFGLYYDPAQGPNWWTYYFEPLIVGTQTKPSVYNPSKQECLDTLRLRRQLTHEEAAALVQTYIRVKYSILEKVDRFAAEHFQGWFVLGVHYRGTDKKSEAPRVAYEEVFEKVRQSLPLGSLHRIFVATDEAQFLEQIRAAFPEQVIALDAHRSTDDVGVHISPSHSYLVGEEALIDCLLLSRCNLLIRTSSNLSLWSTYFNPGLPVILLNRRYGDFPAWE